MTDFVISISGPFSSAYAVFERNFTKNMTSFRHALEHLTSHAAHWTCKTELTDWIHRHTSIGTHVFHRTGSKNYASQANFPPIFRTNYDYISPYLLDPFAIMRGSREVLFFQLVVLLDRSKRYSNSCWAHRMFEISSHKVTSISSIFELKLG